MPPSHIAPMAELAHWPSWRTGGSNQSLRTLRRVWWQGMCLQWLLRPNPAMRSWLASYAMRIGYPTPDARRLAGPARGAATRAVVVGVHIRGGDKAAERHWADHLRQHGPLRYFEAVFELRALVWQANQVAGHQLWRMPTVLYLATDEPVIIEGAERVFQRLLSTESLQRSQAKQESLPKMRLVFDQKLRREFSMADFLTSHPEVAKVSAKEVLTDVHLLAGADYLIATCNSYVSKVASMLFLASQMTRGNFSWHPPRTLGHGCGTQ